MWHGTEAHIGHPPPTCVLCGEQMSEAEKEGSSHYGRDWECVENRSSLSPQCYFAVTRNIEINMNITRTVECYYSAMIFHCTLWCICVSSLSLFNSMVCGISTSILRHIFKLNIVRFHHIVTMNEHRTSLRWALTTRRKSNGRILRLPWHSINVFVASSFLKWIITHIGIYWSEMFAPLPPPIISPLRHPPQQRPFFRHSTY